MTYRPVAVGGTDPLAIARGTVDCGLVGMHWDIDQVLLRVFSHLNGLDVGAARWLTRAARLIVA